MNRPDVVKIVTFRECSSDGQEPEETYYIVTPDGSGGDVDLSFEDIVRIHELTGRVIAEKARKEVRHD